MTRLTSTKGGRVRLGIALVANLAAAIALPFTVAASDETGNAALALGLPEINLEGNALLIAAAVGGVLIVIFTIVVALLHEAFAIRRSPITGARRR